MCLQVGSGAQGEVAGSRQLPRVQTEATHVPLSPLQRPFLRGSRLCQGPRTVLSQTPLWLETHFMNALTTRKFKNSAFVYTVRRNEPLTLSFSLSLSLSLSRDQEIDGLFSVCPPRPGGQSLRRPPRPLALDRGGGHVCQRCLQTAGSLSGEPSSCQVRGAT